MREGKRTAVLRLSEVWGKDMECHPLFNIFMNDILREAREMFERMVAMLVFANDLLLMAEN